jgi:hypothetical protein
MEKQVPCAFAGKTLLRVEGSHLSLAFKNFKKKFAVKLSK